MPIIICCNKGEKCVATDCHVEKSAQAINYDKGVLFPEKLSDGVGLLNLASRLILLLFSLYAVVGLVFCVAIDSIASIISIDVSVATFVNITAEEAAKAPGENNHW